MACLNTKVVSKDPKFQALQEAYKDKHWSDYYLANALQMYREYKEIDDDSWYPETPQERGALTRYINYRLVIDRMQRTGSSMNRDDVYNLYQTLYDAYSPQTLSDRVNMIADDFEDWVDALVKNDSTGRSRLEIIETQGHDGVNGFKAILS